MAEIGRGITITILMLTLTIMTLSLMSDSNKNTWNFDIQNDNSLHNDTLRA